MGGGRFEAVLLKGVGLMVLVLRCTCCCAACMWEVVVDANTLVMKRDKEILKYTKRRSSGNKQV